MVQETETHQERAAAVERVHLHMQGAAGGFGAKGGPACGHGKGGGGGGIVPGGGEEVLERCA